MKDLSKGLKQLSDNAKKLSNKQSVSFDELFPNSFMQRYTKFSSIDEFELESRFDFNDVESIPDDELDVFVSENSSFSNWSDMLGKATEQYVARQLGF